MAKSTFPHAQEYALREALKDGVSVPPAVLADYPDLGPKPVSAEEPKWAIPGSGHIVNGEMVWENRFSRGNFGTIQGHFESTPEAAISSDRKM